MVDSERVSRLLDTVRSDIGFLNRFAAKPPDDLLVDDVALGAMKYRFVTAIEGCVKVAHHLVASEGWAVPETNAGAVVELAGHGVVDHATATSVARAVGFRNVLVHLYADVDDRRVVAQLGRLEDLEGYVTQVAAWLLRSTGEA